MNSMHKGICALCHKDEVLQQSHLIPKAVYKFLRDEKGKSLVIQDNQITIPPGGFQIKEYLLCQSCEEQFSRYEKIVISRIGVAGQKNPLLAILERSTQKYIAKLDDDQPYFVIEGDDSIQLDWDVYYRFSLSVFWRCSISKCKQTFPYYGALGPYCEKIREYLLEERNRTRVNNLFLTVSVQKSVADYLILSPPTVFRNGGTHVHTFIMPNLIFRLYIGNVLPAMFSRLVEENKHVIFLICDIRKERYVDNAITMIQRSKPCGNAKQLFQ